MSDYKNKILVALDGSERAFRTIKYLCSFKPFRTIFVIVARKAKVLAARKAKVSQAFKFSTQKGGVVRKAKVFGFPMAAPRLFLSSLMYPPWRRCSCPSVFIIILSIFHSVFLSQPAELIGQRHMFPYVPNVFVCFRMFSTVSLCPLSLRLSEPA